MRNMTGSNKFPHETGDATDRPSITVALGQLERFCEVTRPYLVELAERARQWEVLERGLPEAFFDPDTGTFARLSRDQDLEDDPLEDSAQPEEDEDATATSRQFEDDAAFVNRLSEVCERVVAIVEGTSEDTRVESGEAMEELVRLRTMYRPEGNLEGDAFDGAIRALSLLSGATEGQDRFSLPSIVVPEVLFGLNETLLRALAEDPELLRGVDSRLFEQLIAEIFRKFQMRVELTKRTRDGGVDIFAFEETRYTNNRYIIECKHYSPERKVGIELVQRLYGVKMSLQVTKAFLVTSSSFSRDARQFAQQHLWELDLKDYRDITAWLRKFWGQRR